MGACCTKPGVEERYLHIPMASAGKRGSGITDLEELFKSWAWDNYLRSASGKKLKFQEAHIDLKWDRVKFKTEELNYDRGPESALSRPSQSLVAFTSKYHNDTAVTQTHAFRADKTTSATVTTCLTKGFAKEANLGLELSLPGEVAKATVGFGLSYTVEAAEENTVERTMTWATDTTVTSEPKSVTLAKLEIEEKNSNWTFKVKVIMKGRITAHIKGTKGVTTVVMTIDGDVATILADRRENNASAVPKEVEINKGKVIWPVEGRCDFRFGIQQNVKVSTEKAGQK